MTLHIQLSEAAEAKLRERAAATGQPPEMVAAHIVEAAVRGPSLDEVLALVREEFDASGMTEDQLTDTLDMRGQSTRCGRRGGNGC